MTRDAPKPVEEHIQEVIDLRQQRQDRDALLSQVSRLAIDLMAAPSGTDTCVLVAESIRSITGALTVGVSCYDAEQQALTIEHVAVDDSIQDRVDQVLGRDVVGMQIPVSEEQRRQMLAEVVSTADSVAESVFGLILGSQTAAAQDLLGSARFIGLSLHHAGELMGGSVLVLGRESADVPGDVLQIMAHLAAVSLQRRQVEGALRESEERYRTLVETSPDGIMVMDLQANILMANEELAKLYGCESPEELLGKSSLEFIAPSEQQRVREGLQRLREPGVFRDQEYQLLRIDGSEFPAEISSSLVVDADGDPRVVISVVRDISQRKQMEEVMRQRNRKLDLLNLAGQALNASLDLSQVLDTVLAKACSLFEVEACSVWLNELQSGDLVCRAATGPHSDLVVGWRLPPGEGLVGWAFHSGQSLIVPDVLVDDRHFRGVEREVGSILRSALNVPMRIKDENIGVLQVLHAAEGHFEETDLLIAESLATSAAIALENARLYEDLNARMSELRDTQAQLIQSAKMAAIGSLAAGVAHEINTPLTSVLGFSELLLEQAEPDDPERPRLQVITRQAGRARDIVQDLLDYARQSEFQREPADPNQILREALALARRQLEASDVAVEEHYADELPTLMVDTGRIKQVLLNLITNALHAMPHAGVLTLRSEQVGAEVALQVADTGQGIPATDTERIFEPFFTTKPVGQGTGLGLSVSLGIVQDHGGRIEVVSQKGTGSTFIVWLPAVPSA